MIEVFKTNVKDAESAQNIINKIQSKVKGVKVNFDLTDRDHILRVEHSVLNVALISQIVSEAGFFAVVL